MKRIWVMSLLMAGIILVDQLTKGAIQSSMSLGESFPVIDGLFNITYVRNFGAAFGMGRNSHDIIRMIFFKIIPVAACFWLLFLIWIERHRNFLHCLVYSLIFAGAVGNLIDRLTMDYVVDFLDFYWGAHHFPAFNVADSAISIAATLYVLDFLYSLIKKDHSKDSSESSSAKEAYHAPGENGGRD